MIEKLYVGGILLLTKEDSMAQYGLGFCYANGLGVNKDNEEAVKWYRLAADQGFAMARRTAVLS
jgi:FOG: TPR repeat, SEL1 subfamily